MLSIVNQKKVVIRSPYATRPWQHVLEPLSGYLQIGQKLLENELIFSDGFNFGSTDEGTIPVKEVVKKIKGYWHKLEYEIQQDENQLHEATLLKLDCSKAHQLLNWHNVWDSETTFKRTVEWYKNFYENININTEEDLKKYVNDAKEKEVSWAVN